MANYGLGGGPAFNTGLTAILQGGGGPVGPYPAPTGYRWGYVTENAQPVTENGQAVIELERIAA